MFITGSEQGWERISPVSTGVGQVQVDEKELHNLCTVCQSITVSKLNFSIISKTNLMKLEKLLDTLHWLSAFSGCFASTFHKKIPVLSFFRQNHILKKRSRKKGKEERKMGGYLIFGSHNKQLVPFSLFEVGRKWGGGHHKRKQRGSCQSDALLWLLSYGWRHGASMRAHAHLQQQGVHWASQPFQPRETSSSGGH